MITTDIAGLVNFLCAIFVLLINPANAFVFLGSYAKDTFNNILLILLRLIKQSDINKTRYTMYAVKRLYKGHALLKKLKSGVNNDYQTWQSVISRCQSEMIVNGQRAKVLMDNIIVNMVFDVRDKQNFLLKYIRIKQYLHIARVQNYEHR